MDTESVPATNSGIPRNSFQFHFYVIPELEGILRHDEELCLTDSGIPGMISADSGIG